MTICCLSVLTAIESVSGQYKAELALVSGFVGMDIDMSHRMIWSDDDLAWSGMHDDSLTRKQNLVSISSLCGLSRNQKYFLYQTQFHYKPSYCLDYTPFSRFN
eukprot:6477329-Amphidinium_carterae.1